MTTPARRNIEIYRGDDYSHELTFVEADGTTPLDVSALTWTAQVRPRLDATAFVSFVVDDAGAATGELVISIPAASTALLPRRRCVWDLQAEDGAGLKTTYLHGQVVVNKDVTR